MRHVFSAALLLTASILGAARLTAGASPATATCGNGLLEEGETCAQCAADCTPQPCRPGKSKVVFSVEFQPPAAPDVSTAVLRIAYRSDRLALPGSGTDKSVQGRIKSPGHNLMAFNDLDYALRVVASGAKAIPAGQILTIEFDRCDGAPAPTAADLSCAVEACAGSTGPQGGCLCTITAAAH
jgi:hypothetical protein